VNEGKARGVPDLLLCERDYHLLNAVAEPLGPMAREQFKKKVRDALSRGATPDTRHMVIGYTSVTGQCAHQPHADLGIVLQNGCQHSVRDNRNNHFRQGLRPVADFNPV